MPPDIRRVLLLSGIGTRVNPYLRLLQEGLASTGVEARLVTSLDQADLDPHGGGADVIHIHWLERYGLPQAHRPRTDGRGPRHAASRIAARVRNSPLTYQVRRWQRLRLLFDQLESFQRAGGCVAYTVHNLEAHETVGWAERWGARRILRLADVLHAHDTGTAEAIAGRTGRRRGVVVVPHGHYLKAYENTIGRVEARGRLALPQDAFVFLSLGLVRPYKGQEELIPAFHLLPGHGRRLIVAGQPAPPTYAWTLERLAAGDDRVRLDFRLVPAAEVQNYMNAADICVLPYRQITTSGAALLAFSFGAPVLAPALGAFPGLIGRDRGVLYDQTLDGSLAAALAEATGRDWQAMRSGIRDWVAQFDWESIGARLVAAYAART